MLYKRKQVYWIDGYVGDKRIKMCTGCKDKEKAQNFYFNLMGESMIKNRLHISIPSKNKKQS